MKSIFLVMLDDCHQDALYWAHADQAKAIKFARAKVKEYAQRRPVTDKTDDYNRIGMNVLLWLEYRDGDHIEVREVKVQK